MNEEKLPNKTQEIPEKFLNTLKWSPYPDRVIGGQQTGMPIRGIKLTSEDMGFEVKTDAFRSVTQSKEFCMECFELFLLKLNLIK